MNLPWGCGGPALVQKGWVGPEMLYSSWVLLLLLLLLVHGAMLSSKGC